MGIQLQQLMTMTRQVLFLTEQELILIKAQLIKGQLNVVTDLASRLRSQHQII